MKGAILSSRYAKSLLLLAIEQNSVEAVYEDMQQLAAACKESRELALLLKSPIVNADKKRAIFREVFEGKLEKLTNAFVELMMTKRREYHLEGVAQSFLSQYRTYKNITTASITTAIALDDAARTKVRELVQKSYPGMDVVIEENIDKDIIGGFIMRVGDQQVNASIKRKLHDLKMEFSKNPYVRDF